MTMHVPVSLIVRLNTELIVRMIIITTLWIGLYLFAGNTHIEFTEELRLGPGKGPEYVWPGYGAGIDADKHGRMYVMDYTSSRIVILNASGDLLKIIQGKGQGPGSLWAIDAFRVLDDGTLYVLDNRLAARTLLRYDQNHQFLDQTNLPVDVLRSSEVSFSFDAQYFGGLFKRIDRSDSIRQYFQVSVVNHQGVARLTAFKTGYQTHKVDLRKKNWADYYAQLIEEGRKLGVIAFGADGSIYAAPNNAYQITRWNKRFDMIYDIKRDYKPYRRNQERLDLIREEFLRHNQNTFFRKHLTDEYIEAAIEKVQLPPILAPILGLAPMEDGALIVIRNHDPATRVTTADIIGPDGAFLGQTALPKISVDVVGELSRSPSKLLFRHGFAYALEPNDDLEYELVRYRWKYID